MNVSHLPHAKTVIGFCIAAIIGYAVFSGWVVFYAKDATMMGDVIGTWKSFAVLAFGFWLGSSSGGKSHTGPSGTPDDPVVVEGAPPGSKPVTTKPAEENDQ